MHSLGPVSNLKKLQNGTFGTDATFCLKDTVRKINGFEIKFSQVLQIVRKLEKEVINEDGSTSTVVAVEPLFLVLMKNKTTQLYTELWTNLCDLYVWYFGGQLLPG